MCKAEVWRELAAEALLAANDASDPEAKRSLMAIALAYQKLAERAEQQQENNTEDDPEGTS